MGQFENLLPYISNRVTTFGQTKQGGRFARFDDDLYVHPLRLATYFVWNDVLQLRFYLFFNPDGTHAMPPIEILGDFLQPRLRGYDLEVPGGILGDPELRALRRRAREELGWGKPQLLFVQVKDSLPIPLGAPRSWAEVWFLILPRHQRGPDGYDWAELGARTLSSLDTILHLAESARPTRTSQPVEPR